MIAFFLLLVSASASGAGPEAIQLTISEAVKLAIQKNPSVERAREKENEADHARSQAFSYVLPTVTAGFAFNYKKDALNGSSPLFGGEPYNLYGFNLQATQPLYRGGALSAGLAVAREQKEINTLDRRIAERDLAFNVIQSFYSVLHAQVKLETLERTEKLKEQLLAVAKQRQKIGRSPLLDVLRAKTQMALLAPKVATARNEAQLTGTELGLLLGKTGPQGVTVRGGLASPSWERVKALIGSPNESLELSRQERQLTLVNEKGDYTLSANWPQLSAVGAIGRAGFLKSDLLDGDATSWALGLQATIPIFSGLSSYQERAIIASQRRQLELEKNAIADSVELERTRAERELELGRAAIESSRLSLEFAQAAQKEAQKDYRLSTTDLQSLIASEENLVEAENAFNQARYDFVLRLARYFKAWGHDLSDLVKLLDGVK